MKRRTRNNLPLIAAYSAALIICAGGLGYAALQTMGKISSDRLGCFDSVPGKQSFVLLDASEPRFTLEQKRSVRAYLDQHYEALAFNERLAIYTSEGDQVASVLKPRFHVCGQASRPEQLEEIGAAGGQAGYLKKQKQRLYDKVLASELDKMLSDDLEEQRRQLYQSPMLELIADLSRAPNFKPGSRLIVISDLIQNSDSVKFCREQNHMPPFDVFERRNIYQERLKPESFEGISVELLMLQRYGFGKGGLRYCRDEEEIKSFWRGYFKANGARSVRFIRIRQGAEG